jgi:hypothetical protein
MTASANAALRNGGEFYGWRYEAGTAHAEGSEISGWRQKERGDRNDKTRRPATREQATTAGNKGVAIAAPTAALAFIFGETQISPQKHRDAHRVGGPGASHENALAAGPNRLNG